MILKLMYPILEQKGQQIVIVVIMLRKSKQSDGEMVQLQLHHGHLLSK